MNRSLLDGESQHRTNNKPIIAANPDAPTSLRLTQQRRRLLRMRTALSGRIKQLADEAREDTPIYSEHMADAATDSFDRDLTLGLVSFVQEALYEIDAALKRIDDGTYGICELTGRPISWARLQAIPWTRFSVAAEKMIEGPIHPHIGELRTITPAEIEPK